jgi:iron(III) transport system substrate-binding protein
VWRLVIVLVALSGLTAACGDDGDDAGAPDPDPGGPATTREGGDGGGPSDPEWDTIVAAAEVEGAVTLYTTHLDPQQEALRQVFEAQYPDIDLMISRIVTPAEMASALDAEESSGAAGADVAIMTDLSIPAGYHEAGKLRAPVGPNVAAWNTFDGLIEGHYFVTNYTVNGIAWNTDQVDGPLSSYEDLLDPALAGGRIGIVDAALAPIITDYWAFVEENTSDGFLEALAAQNPVVYGSTAPILQAVISGEISVAMYSTPDILAERDNGAPVDFSVTEPTWGPPFVAFSPTWSRNPNAALVLLDVLMSVEGQEALSSNGSPVRPDAQGFTSIDNVTPVNSERATPAHSDDYLPRWNSTFGR